jgi:hypothetical protein
MKLAILAPFDQVCEASALPVKPITVCITGDTTASLHLAPWFQAEVCR